MRAVGLLALAIGMFIAGLTTSISFFFHLTYVLLGVLVVAYLWAWSNLEGLEMERESTATRAQVGEIARERLTIRNLWPFPKLWVEVRDHSELPSHGGGFVGYIPRHDRRRWTMRTPCLMRGKWRLGPVTVHGGDPFGIFRLYKHVDLTNELLVYPATVDLPNFNVPSAELIGGQDVRFHTFHVTPNVASIRQYAPGDSFNRIHWRSTARTGQLMVKEFELDPTADVWIVLDMEQRFHYALNQAEAARTNPTALLVNAETTEEYAVTAAASLARHFLRQNRTTGLMMWGEFHQVIPPEREARQLFKILEALAAVHPRPDHPLAELLAAESNRFGRNDSIIIITPSLDKRWIDSLQHLVYRGARAAVIFVDSRTFGSYHNPEPMFTRMAELRVPVYRVKQGEPLARSLATPEVVARGRG